MATSRWTLPARTPAAAELRPGNPTIDLTYTKLGIWEVGNPSFYSEYSIQRNYVVFGFKTAPADMPVSGSANYSGLIFGVAGSDGPAKMYYSLGGTVDLTANFASGRWSGSLDPVGTNRNGGAIRDFGTFTFSNGTISGNELLGTDLLYGSAGDVGDVWGMFFGPNAAEFGGGYAVFLGSKD